VRREIIRLDELGVITRFHGGAGRGGSGTRLSYEAKQALDADLKARIGIAVAAEIRPGACIFLDVGTTAEATARALATMRGLRVVTPGGAIARILSEAGGIEVVLTGGRIMGQDLSMAGPVALRTVSSYRFDHAIIACSGIDADGAVLDFDADKIALKQAAMQFASHKMLIADSGKFGRQALIEVARVSDFDLLVTDQSPMRDRANWAESVQLRLAAE
jgi:DeoR family glycerol-3-phosphate regulon repressor